VLKIGGSVGVETDAALDAVVALNDAGHPLVVVHGGGPLVGDWAERLGMETRFVRGLRLDYDAVLNGLTLPHSSGAVEGNVNRIKMIKRQMYGRAKFDLLRKRILHAA